MFFTESFLLKDPKFEILLSSSQQYYFNLIAPNGKVIATSEMYNSKQACEKGIESVKLNAPKAKVVDYSG